ncbi:MAG: hypothetical protein P8170_00220 [Gemmatimonadota bacterium]|jgi:hypothetical protein
MSESDTTREPGSPTPGSATTPEGPRKGRRLPPPAFPPGERGPRAGALREAHPGEMADAMISPSDPRPVRAPAEDEEELPAKIDPREVRVTGIGDDERREPTVVRLAEDPPVMEVVEMVGRLARALRQRGQAALQVTPEMSPFEATLRAYCVGYVAGRRGEEEGI